MKIENKPDKIGHWKFNQPSNVVYRNSREFTADPKKTKEKNGKKKMERKERKESLFKCIHFEEDFTEICRHKNIL